MKTKYINAKDLHELTGIGMTQCRELMKKLQEQALEEGYFIPKAKGYIAPYEVVKRVFRWK